MTAVCGTGFNWAFNSLGQSPCVIAEVLVGACHINITIGPLDPQNPLDGYVGPQPTMQNPCFCSTVFYSLLSACATCQSHGFSTWSQYDQNCTNVYTDGFPETVPQNTVIPDYANQNISATNTFNVTAAEGSSSSASVASPSPTGFTSSSTGKSIAGPVAGGVVGGVVFLGLVASIIYCFFYRRRRSRVVSPAVVNLNAGEESFSPPPMSYASLNSSSPVQTLKLYNPSDPSTFPPSPVTSAMYTTRSNHDNHQPQFGTIPEL